MKDALSFCDVACGKYHMPVLLVQTRETAGSFVAWMVDKFSPILVDPAPTSLTLLSVLRREFDRKSTEKAIKRLQGLNLYISDKKSYSETEWSQLIASRFAVVFIDDLSAVPDKDFLEKWSEKHAVTVVGRNAE